VTSRLGTGKSITFPYSVIFDLVLVEDMLELLHDPGLRVEELDGEVHQLTARNAIRKIVSAR
jgi:hypothetical protein